MTDAATVAFMQQAAEEARRGIAKVDGGPFGALLVRRGIVVSRAHNEVLVSKDPTAHAEILAIRRAAGILQRFHLDDCILYTTCEPCPMCLSAVAWARIPRLYFGCTRDDAAEIGFSDRMIYDWIRDEPGVSPAERISLERETCLRLFRDWRNSGTFQLY